jgi:type II secretory pathway pseudopilin PulG
MGELDCSRGRRLKNGITLLELLVVIGLISVIVAMFSKIVFPKKEDMQKKDPKEALELAIRMAREEASDTGEAVLIHFVDQKTLITMEARTAPDSNRAFLINEANPDYQKSVLDFFHKMTEADADMEWPTGPAFSKLTNAPLFIVRNKKGEAILREDKVRYVPIINPTKNQLTDFRTKAFERGHVDTDGKWKGTRKSSAFFEVHPSGMCDSVSFKGEKCPAYNREYVVDPIAGSVKVH